MIRMLRGADTSTGALAEDDQQLLKFHGVYQQDDRDLRAARRQQKLEKAQVAINLVINAQQAIEGSQRLPGRILIRLSDSGKNVRLEVGDNGPGVDARVKARLFEPFVTGRPSGVGIGLAMSRRIARAHGGDLVLEESSGGASFWTRPRCRRIRSASIRGIRKTSAPSR